MLVNISIATDKMIQLVAMYPDAWFMDTNAGQFDAIVLNVFLYYMYSFVV